MDLFICEKPSQGKDLAAVLGATKSGSGCLSTPGGDRVVTWAFGHLLELYMPDDYDPALKKWQLDNLPIAPDSWKSRVKKTSAQQYKIIKDLVAKAKTVYIATDYDREGEAIARSLLDRFRFSGDIKRVCLTALDTDSIKKALGSIKDGSETKPLYYAAISRQRADWLIGMNVSRLYTVLAREVGYSQTLHVGRVLTPTISLVVDRDNSISSFVPSPFYVMDATIQVQSGSFVARWQAPEDFSDDQGRCVNSAVAQQVAAAVAGASAAISHATTKKKKESAPLPLDLNSLQQFASRRWGYTGEQVLGAAQSLYETHKALTYPRTDSRYLPDSQHGDAPAIFQSLMKVDQSFSGLVAGADIKRKGRAFNDKKVTAHHAIIPTTNPNVSLDKMSEIERCVYDAARLHYVAQFYSDAEYLGTDIVVESQGHQFKASGKIPTQQGWKLIFQSTQDYNPSDEQEQSDSADSGQQKLPHVQTGEPAHVLNASVTDKMTKPSPHFTEATLLSAMENIAKYVDEPQFKQVLKESSGLGTPATRSSIIQGAIDKGYISRSKKVLLATDKARSLIVALPPAITSPGMTAAWEQELEKIASGEGQMSSFMQHISAWICDMVENHKKHHDVVVKKDGRLAQAFAAAIQDSPDSAVHPCFKCGSDMKRRKGRNGFFWACTSDSCKTTCNDKRGKPEGPPPAPPANAPSCPECGGQMIKRKSKKTDTRPASSFWGCSSFPKCKGVVQVPTRKRKATAS